MSSVDFSAGRRIIPARAGFTDNPTDFQVYGKDHPRSRGVYLFYLRGNRMADGSSPLARGLHCAHGRPVRIPTDHPRSRGVYRLGLGFGVEAEGSSPLARGLPEQYLEQSSCDRIIPARAGFTCDKNTFLKMAEDHPRSRGVYQQIVSDEAAKKGSSPLARGLPFRFAQFPRHSGIIPARAGFTCGAEVRARGESDHPRSRGVYADGVQ